jgi:hypothetical protein
VLARPPRVNYNKGILLLNATARAKLAGAKYVAVYWDERVKEVVISPLSIVLEGLLGVAPLVANSKQMSRVHCKAIGDKLAQGKYPVEAIREFGDLVIHAEEVERKVKRNEGRKKKRISG